MSLATIRAAIEATLTGVAGIGAVHDYERYAKTNAELAALYTSGGRLHGWHFYREAAAEEDLNNGEVRRLHRWKIRGFMSLDDADATGIVFDDLVEAIATAFRTDPTLGGACLANKNLDQEFGPSGIQVESITPVMFANVLCHRAELSLITETTEPVL